MRLLISKEQWNQKLISFDHKTNMVDHQAILKWEKIQSNVELDNAASDHHTFSPLEETKEVVIPSPIEDVWSRSDGNTLNRNFDISGTNYRMRDRTAAELGLRKRKDVVLKTLLRKIRSLIKDNFILYSKNFKRKNDKQIENIQRRVKGYISNCMEEEPTDSFWDTFGVFIWTEQIEETLYQLSEHQHKMELVKKIKEVRETLYKFSFSRLTNLFDYAGMTEIIKHYSKIQNQDLLSNDEKIGVQILLEESKINYHMLTSNKIL